MGTANRRVHFNYSHQFRPMSDELVRILLAEEDSAEADRIQTILKQVGPFDLTRVGELEGARQILQTQSINLMFLSLSLPGGVGLEGIAGLHAVAPDTAIVVTVNAPNESMAAQAIHLGAQEYFVKSQVGGSALERIVRNALERTKLQQALRQSEDRYRDLVEHSEDLICTHDLEGKLLSANVTASRNLGYGPDHWRGRNVRDILAPETHAQFDDYLQKIRTHGSAKGLMIVLTAQGERRVWEYKNSLRSEGVSTPIVRGMAHDVTEQKRVEKALREQADVLEEQARLLDLAHEAIIVIDQYGAIRFWNRGAEMIYGFSRKEAIGKISHVLLQTECSNPMQSIMAVVDREGYWEGELVQTNHDGKRIDVLSRWTLNRDEQGAPQNILTINSDISDRKQAQRVLEESNSLLRATLESTADGILVVDNNGTIRTFNQRFAKMWGIPDSLANKNSDSLLVEFVMGQLIHPQQFLQKIKELYAQPEAESYDILEFIDGKVFERYSRPQRIAQKSVGRVWSFRDISEHQRAAEALRRSEEKYRTLFEESKDVVFISTPEGKFLDINPAGLELFGFSSKEDMQQADIRKLFVDPAERKRYVATIQGQGYVKDFELTLLRKDGSKLEVLETSTAVTDDQGNIVAYHGILRDVTQIKQLQQQLAQLQRIETIGRLTGGVAHDFNNILMAIYGNCELLLTKIEETDPVRADVEEVLKSAERGAMLTRQMLAFSRKQVLSPRVLDLNQLLSGIESMLQSLIGDEIELVTKFDPQLGSVHADPAQLEQVIVHLVVNARDAMPDGGKIVVETSNAELDEDFARRNAGAIPGRYVMVSVTDNGCGMDETTVSRIFEPFFTTKEVGKGTGLGLSMVYGIVKQSGGYILVQSEPEKGSSFTIYLPRAHRLADGNDPRSSEASRTSRHPLTVLLVDDNDIVRNVITQMLELKGFNVMTASSGRQALEMASQNHGTIDVLITDVIMPSMSGPELAAQIRSDRPALKILFISGYAEKEIFQTEKMPAGAAFLTKPAAMDAILRKIVQLIQA